MGRIICQRKYSSKINWYRLSTSPSTGTISILERNLDKVDWFWLSRNLQAIHILEQNLDKVHWKALVLNQSMEAMHLLKQHPDKVDWETIMMNPAIFVLDTEKMKKNCKPFCEELCTYVFSPNRVMRSIELFNYNISTDEVWVKEDE